MNNQTVDQIGAQLKNNNHRIRYRAICEIVKYGENALPYIQNAVIDENKLVALKAIKILSEMKDNTSIPYLLKALSNPDKSIVSAAAAFLAQVGDETAIDALAALLSKTSEYVDKFGYCKWEIHGYAIEGLARIGLSSLNRLYKVLQSDDNTARRNAAHAIGKIHNKSSLPIIVNALSSESDRYTIFALLEAIAELEPIAVLPHIDKLLMLEDDFSIGSTAAKIITKANESAILQIITNKINSKLPFYRRNIAECLSEIQDDKAIELLYGLLFDCNVKVRESAAFNLAGHKMHTGVKYLLKALEAENVETTQSVLHNIFSYEGSDEILLPCLKACVFLWKKKELVEARWAIDKLQERVLSVNDKYDFSIYLHDLIDVFLSGNLERKLQVAPLLASIGDIRAAHPLATALKEDIYGQETFLKALIAVCKNDAKPLIEIFKDNTFQTSVRKEIADALGSFKTEECINTLISALFDSDENIISSGALSLGKIGSYKAIPLLIQRLYEISPENKHTIALSIGMMGEAAINPLTVLISKSDNADIRKYIPIALGETKSESAIKCLLDLIKDSTYDERKEIIFAFGRLQSLNTSMMIQLMNEKRWDVAILYAESILLHNAKLYMNHTSYSDRGYFSDRGFIDESFNWSQINESFHRNQYDLRHPFDILLDFISTQEPNKKAAQSIEVIRSLWSIYSKGCVVRPYGEWQSWEPLLSISQPTYKDHIIHQLNVFNLGCAIFKEALTSYDGYNYYFPWLLSATFHDFAYPLESLGNIISWLVSFCQDSIHFKGKSVIDCFNSAEPDLCYASFIDELVGFFQDYCGLDRITSQIWKEYFRFKLEGWDSVNKDGLSIKMRDHGVIAGLILPQKIKPVLEGLTNIPSNSSYYVQSWYEAALSIAFHTFQGTTDIIRFSKSAFYQSLLDTYSITKDDIRDAFMFDTKKFPLVGLLMLCDEIQDWGRPRYDFRNENQNYPHRSFLVEFKPTKEVIEIGICYLGLTDEDFLKIQLKLKDKFGFLDGSSLDENSFCIRLNLYNWYSEIAPLAKMENPIEVSFPRTLNLINYEEFPQLADIFANAVKIKPSRF